MPSVKVKENEPFEYALRRFKRSCEKAGVIAETRRREFYEKPTQERRPGSSWRSRRRSSSTAASTSRTTATSESSSTTSTTTSSSGRSCPVPPSMSLKNRLSEDVKAAMRAGEKKRLGTLRMTQAAIKQKEVDERVELDDTAVLALIDKLIKQRRDSAEQYRAGNREDLASAEEAEIEILQAYLPEPLGDDELDAIIDAAIRETGATGMADMGRVMGQIKPQVQGRADMGAVSGRVRERLS